MNSLTTVGLSTCVSVPVKRLPGNTLSLEPMPGMMLLKLVLSSRSNRPRTLNRVFWLSTVSTRVTMSLRWWIGVRSDALLPAQAFPDDGSILSLGSGSRLSIDRPIELKYFGLTMLVCVDVPEQATPLMPPVPAAQ